MDIINPLDRNYFSGPQKIRQRYDRCNCGCNGTDWAHAQKIMRAVRNVEKFEEPVAVQTGEYPYVPALVIAVADYAAADTKRAGLEVTPNGYVIGWIKIRVR